MEIIKVISFQHLAISKPFQKLSRNNSFRVRREIFLPEKAVEYFKMFQYYKIGKSLKKMLYPLRNFFYKKICTLQFKLSTQYSLIFRLFKNPILCQLLSKSPFCEEIHNLLPTKIMNFLFFISCVSIPAQFLSMPFKTF